MRYQMHGHAESHIGACRVLLHGTAKRHADEPITALCNGRRLSLREFPLAALRPADCRWLRPRASDYRRTLAHRGAAEPRHPARAARSDGHETLSPPARRTAVTYIEPKSPSGLKYQLR